MPQGLHNSGWLSAFLGRQEVFLVYPQFSTQLPLNSCQTCETMQLYCPCHYLPGKIAVVIFVLLLPPADTGRNQHSTKLTPRTNLNFIE